MTGDLAAPLLVGVTAAGMAFAFASADRDSPASRALAAGLVCLGFSVVLNVGLRLQWPADALVTRWYALPEAGAMTALLQWILHLRRMLPGAKHSAAGDALLRAGQCAAVLFGAVALAWPELRERYFIGSLGRPAPWREAGFWLFATPILFGAATAVVAMTGVLRRRPERAERNRIWAMIAAAPFLVLALVLPPQWNSLAVGLALMVILAGAVRYHVLQGQSAQFLTRFLSPQVGKLVSERGLRGAMRQNRHAITVVCCDLRGFSHYAQSHPTEYTLQLLREYYRAVGAAVADAGATLKDFVGDGALILVGAPLPMADHAAAGLSLAQRLHDSVRTLLRRWSPRLHRLGVGIGVASGEVLVGVIATASRYEYVAVGPAVNLASRLCEAAVDGEVLVHESTISAIPAGSAHFTPAAPLLLKGFEAAVPCSRLLAQEVRRAA
jgi:class 3 adenylate cyclase